MLRTTVATVLRRAPRRRWMTTQGHAEPALVRPVHFPPHQGSRPPLFFVVGALLNALAVLHYIHDYDDVDFDGLARRASAASIAPRAAAKALDDLSLAVSSFSEARSFFDFAPGARLVRSARGLDAMQLSLEAGDVHTKTEGARLVWLVSERAVDARAMMRSRPDVASACLRLWRACLSDKALFCVDCGSPPEAIDLVMAAVLNLLAAGAFPAALDVELAGLMRDTAALVASGASFEPLLALADGHDAAWANEMALTLAKMCNAAPTAAAQGCAATLASAVAKSGSWVDVEARARLAAWRAGGLVQRQALDAGLHGRPGQRADGAGGWLGVGKPAHGVCAARCGRCALAARDGEPVWQAGGSRGGAVRCCWAGGQRRAVAARRGRVSGRAEDAPGCQGGRADGGRARAHSPGAVLARSRAAGDADGARGHAAEVAVGQLRAVAATADAGARGVTVVIVLRLKMYLHIHCSRRFYTSRKPGHARRRCVHARCTAGNAASATGSLTTSSTSLSASASTAWPAVESR